MARITNRDRIIKLLSQQSRLDDDEISELTEIKPRQQVNQICRDLVRLGKLKRFQGPKGKIVNQLVNTNPSKVTSSAAKTAAFEALPRWKTELTATSQTAPHSEEDSLATLDLQHLRDTLLIIPCCSCKKKLPFPDARETRSRIAQYLTADLAERLYLAREEVRVRARIDEKTLIPAWRRYDGYLYRAKGARETLCQAVEQGLHVLILSGGYGVLLADEPIGLYEAQFKTSWWPKNLLEEVIASYTRYHQLKYMRAFVSKSKSNGYRSLVKRVNWCVAGVDDAVLLIPKCVGGGAQSKVPRAQGEAMAALVKGELSGGWRSSDGLALICKRLR
ncbi:MAG: hypothetical protein OXH16_24395 [Gemmatimonadetes bacterium]|nr:hypothetical protein [Gemmatimonadota bacterium]